jgi:translation initiation factor 4G
MDSFGATVGDRTLPPGTTSAERFAMPSSTAPRSNLNHMASFNRAQWQSDVRSGEANRKRRR